MLELVMDMGVDKVADEMADMEIDMKVAPPCGQIFNWRKWRHLVAKFSTKESASTWWPNFQIMHVAPPSGQISNNCMWRHLEAKFPTYASQADWWPYFQQLQVVSLGGKAKLWFWQLMILMEMMLAMVIRVVNVDKQTDMVLKELYEIIRNEDKKLM